MSGGDSSRGGGSLVCEYYCEVGVRDRLVTAGTNRCPASAPPADLLLESIFEPFVLLRLPAEDRLKGMRFAPEVAMFAFPHGVRLVTPEVAAANAMPVVTSFVLTAADKSRMYGACIVWYEKLATETAASFVDGAVEQSAGATSPPPDDAARREAVSSMHAPEAICLLSRSPVFDALMECCRQLFRMKISGDGVLPETALAPLLSTPLPSFGQSCALPLGNISVPVSVPAANQLPHTMSGRDFLHLFQCLDVSNVMLIWALLLAEQKVVLQAKQPHILTMAAETLSALLFPFSWQHVYIPILPARLLDILQASQSVARNPYRGASARPVSQSAVTRPVRQSARRDRCRPSYRRRCLS